MFYVLRILWLPILYLFICMYIYSLKGQPTHHVSGDATSTYRTSTRRQHSTAPPTTASSTNGKSDSSRSHIKTLELIFVYTVCLHPSFADIFKFCKWICILWTNGYHQKLLKYAFLQNPLSLSFYVSTLKQGK